MQWEGLKPVQPVFHNSNWSAAEGKMVEPNYYFPELHDSDMKLLRLMP